MLYKCLSHSFCSHILAQFKYYLLLRQSVIIRRFVQPSLDSRSTTKSMNIFCQICLIQVKASRSLVSSLFSCCSYDICHNFSRMYRTCSISGQKNCHDKRASVTSLLSVQSLLSHVYTESVLYKEILMTALSVFHKE
jgi:hypothetical protein